MLLELEPLICLKIDIDFRYLEDMEKYLKINKLREFHISGRCKLREDVNALNILLNYLADKANLSKLAINLYDLNQFDGNVHIHSALHSFNLVSLALDCRFLMTDFIVQYPSSRLEHLQIFCSLGLAPSVEQIIFIVQNWTKLETIVIDMYAVKRLLNDVWMNKLLKISITRPTLTILFDCRDQFAEPFTVAGRSRYAYSLHCMINYIFCM